MDFNIDKLETELRNDEGTRHVPYRDSAGNWTVGVGHELDRDPYPKEYWSDDKIGQTLLVDIGKAVHLIEGQPWYASLDTDTRRRAMINMAFNLGNRLFEFKNSLELIRQKRWKDAANHLRESLWYSEVTARAERICKMLENG